MRVRRLAKRILDLNFVDAAQIDAAVAALRNIYLKRELEILELPVRAQIAVILVRLTRRLNGIVNEHAVYDLPSVGGIRISKSPARQVPAIEQLDRPAESH